MLPTTAEKKRLIIRQDTTAALRVKTTLKAGYLGGNPGTQGRNETLF